MFAQLNVLSEQLTLTEDRGELLLEGEVLVLCEDWILKFEDVHVAEYSDVLSLFISLRINLCLQLKF